MLSRGGEGGRGEGGKKNNCNIHMLGFLCQKLMLPVLCRQDMPLAFLPLLNIPERIWTSGVYFINRYINSIL